MGGQPKTPIVGSIMYGATRPPDANSEEQSVRVGFIMAKNNMFGELPSLGSAGNAHKG